MRYQLSAALCCAFMTLVCLGEVRADAFSRKIPTGASFGEVLGIWGEPVDKVEKDILRQVVWYYPDGAKVVFKDGRVLSWQPTKAVRAMQEQQVGMAKAKAASTEVELSGEARDLVRDIAREVPSGPDVPGGGGSSAVAPPPLIPNQVPPGGRGEPAGMVPSDVVVNEVDELED